MSATTLQPLPANTVLLLIDMQQAVDHPSWASAIIRKPKPWPRSCWRTGAASDARYAMSATIHWQPDRLTAPVSPAMPSSRK